MQRSGGSEVTEVGDGGRGLRRQTRAFLQEGLRPPVMFAGCVPPL